MTAMTHVDDDRTPLALAAGLVAALLGGVAWAGIVIVTDYEIGWVAWAIGALVGIAMARTTPRRSGGLAVAAATLALVGLLAGKAFTTMASTGEVAEQLTESPEYLQGTVAWQLYGEGELEPATMEAIEATDAAGDTLSDAVWADMLAQAAAHLEVMSEAERRALADEVATELMAGMGVIGGIRAQLSAFDLLWVLLALGTAFRIMAAPKEEAVEAVAPEPEETPVA